MDQIGSSQEALQPGSISLSLIPLPKPSSQPILASQSIRIDGKESVEHQLSLHLSDLLLYTNPLLTSQDPHLPSLSDILAGIQYVLTYRIQNRKMPHLDKTLCQRLSAALLSLCDRRENRYFRGSLFTSAANQSFVLWAGFLLEVQEFVECCLLEWTISRLRVKLGLGERILDETQRETALVVLGVLIERWTGSDQTNEKESWKEWILPEHREKVLPWIEQASPFPTRLPPPSSPVYPPQLLYFDREVNKVIALHQTDLERGLTQTQVEALQLFHGKNSLPTAEQLSIGQLLWHQVTDFMVLILIITMIVAAIIDRNESPASAIVLGVVIVFNVTIGFTQELKAQQSLLALLSLQVPKARVIRDGVEQDISSIDLVPGDICLLNEGDAIPADLRLCQVSHLEVMESVLTGESEAVSKNVASIKGTRAPPLADCYGNAFMTCTVARGRAKGVVVRVGKYTAMGRIATSLTSSATPPAPIQVQLTRLGKVLVFVALILSALVAVLGVAWGRPVADMIRIGVSLAVSVIPEGLVAVTTVTLALSVKRMADEKALVRHLSSVETLGSVNVICSDKTGTLTKGEMKVKQCWTLDNEIVNEIVNNAKVDDNNHANNADFWPHQQNSLFFAYWICFHCHNATLATASQPALGDPTEVALLEAALKHLGSKTTVWKRWAEAAFDSERKMMSVLVESRDNEELNASKDHEQSQKTSHHRVSYILTKGAPECVIQRCSKIRYQQQDCALFDTTLLLEKVTLAQQTMAHQGLRVLALAYKQVQSTEEQAHYLEAMGSDETLPLIEKDLCFIALIGLTDPPREHVKEAIETCHQAGIEVVMITGDHYETAMAIARELGIMKEHSIAMRGTDLDSLTRDALAEMHPFPSVFARTTPDHKLFIVEALQSRGQIVAMTGDGVNDAPAIKKADVGIAMGLTGTRITQEAADIILLNDHFTSIVSAIHEGRRVYDNIIKFLIYLLSCNSSEILLVLVAVALNQPSPLTALPILFANIIADVPTSLSLGVEGHERASMQRVPRKKEKWVLDRKGWTLLMVQGVIMATVSLLVYFYTLNDSSLLKARSDTFFCLTSIQLLLTFLNKTLSLSFFASSPFSNPWMLLAFTISFTLLLLGHSLTGFNQILELTFLDGESWLKMGVAWFVVWFVVEMVKFVFRWDERRMRRRENELNNGGIALQMV